jgi:toxin ParE1/3/4
MAERRYRAVWADAAVADLEELVTFVADTSALEGERLLERTRRIAQRLESLPNRGHIVPEFLRFGIGGWRELVAKPYRLVYRVTGDTVTVAALFDGRRDLEDVLLERLLRSR